MGYEFISTNQTIKVVHENENKNYYSDDFGVDLYDSTKLQLSFLDELKYLNKTIKSIGLTNDICHLSSTKTTKTTTKTIKITFTDNDYIFICAWYHHRTDYLQHVITVSWFGFNEKMNI